MYAYVKDEDWFCKRCTSKKEEAIAWKPEKMDELPDVLPARSTPRGKRGGGGGSKSETKVS